MVRKSFKYFILSIMVSVLRGNDNNIEVAIIEEMKPGSDIVNIRDKVDLTQYSKTDLDSISFVFLHHTNHTKHMTMDSQTGVIRTASTVDRERLCPSAEICLLKADIAIQPKRYFRVIKLTVTIIDINDNVPSFPENPIRRNLSESVPPGAVILIPPAYDPDSPAFGVTRYDLLPHGNHRSKFRLVAERSTDGSFDLSLRLKDPLDREIQDVHRMTLMAYDGGNPSKSGSAVIEVFVSDENDNPPQFDKAKYIVEVAENAPIGKHLERVRASDPDQGQNAKIYYRLSVKSSALYGSLFAVGRDSGWVSLTGKLDYESNSTIILEVLAENEGNVTSASSTFVVLNIVDVNDNVPEMTMDPSTDVLRVTEHCENNTVLALISVFDPDSGRGGRVNCHLQKNDGTMSPHFRLTLVYENEYTIVTTSDLDREVADSYHLVLICRDGGQPVLESRKNLRIVVDDIDDHKPEFTQRVYNISIKENSATTDILLTVSATDTDVGENSDIKYNLPSDTDPRFIIDKFSGDIRSTIPFDRERADVYQFYVRASDREIESHYSTRRVVINVLDENDEAPRFFESEYAFSVPEDVPVYTAIARLEAYDKDLPPNNEHFYYLQDASNSSFQVDSVNGTLFVNQALDRETNDEYQMLVVVKDAHQPQLQDKTSVRINVRDVNDNSPEIQFPAEGNNTVFVSKSAPVGHLVTRVIARDADLGANAKLTFAMVLLSAKNDREVFSIDSELGNIVVNSDLGEQNKDSFELLIVVKDGGIPTRTSQATLRVVLNAPPSFDEPDEEPETRSKFLVTNQYLLIGGSMVAFLAFVVILVLLIFCSARGCGRKRPLVATRTVDRGTIENQILRVDDSLPRSAGVQKDYGFDGILELNDDASSRIVLNRPPSDDLPSLSSDSPFNMFSGRETTCTLVASPHFQPQQLQDSSCLNQHVRLPNADFDLRGGLTRSPQLSMQGRWPITSRGPLVTDLLNHGRPNGVTPSDYRPLKAYDDLYFNNYTCRFEPNYNVDSNPLHPEPPYPAYDNGSLFNGINSMERPKRRPMRELLNYHQGGLYHHPVASCSNIA